jgi:hypothetical protein
MNNAFILDISQRIGWTLVHSVWQFALIALCARHSGCDCYGVALRIYATVSC